MARDVSADPFNPSSSATRLAQGRAQRACWRVLALANAVLDLSVADVIEVVGADAAAHVALLARQFPGVAFELGAETQCPDAVRVLWATGPLEPAAAQAARSRCDAAIIPHAAGDLRATLAAFAGHARIGAVREAGDGLALAVFGRGLARDLFRPRARGHLAA